MTADRATLEGLLAMVEAATGPDRELDARIDAGLFGGRAARDFTEDTAAARLRHSYGTNAVFNHTDPATNGGNVLSSMVRHAAPVTASIDAALALAERCLLGVSFSLSRKTETNSASYYVAAIGGHVSRVEGTTPALAILAALLRALIARAA